MPAHRMVPIGCPAGSVPTFRRPYLPPAFTDVLLGGRPLVGTKGSAVERLLTSLREIVHDAPRWNYAGATDGPLPEASVPDSEVSKLHSLQEKWEMKRANSLTFRIALYVLACVLCVSCSGVKFEQDGYVVVKNRLRLKSRDMPYPTTNGVLKVAAQIGRLPADLVIHGFNVTNGCLSIHGRDGELRLLPEGNAEVVKTGYGTKKFKFRYPAVTLVLIDTPYEASRQTIRFQRVMSHAQDFPSHNDGGYWGISPRLYSSTSNGFHLISIPYTVSPDFQGDMGKATLMSNWYDF